MAPSRLALCIAVVALAAFIPGALMLVWALVDPGWVLLPDLASVPLEVPDRTHPERLLALLAVLPSRAPPSLLAA
jgi:hypothetical protein